ncbi:MAG: hypothetical protein IJ038_06500 [Clostridia bacterium]|nr:hypothetical protein [Clostridia bacterium]
MKKDGKLLTVFGTYAAALLLAAIIAIIVITSKISVSKEVVTETSIETEYVYVYAGGAPQSTSPATEATTASVWTVKEYEGKIGIFTEDGRLAGVIDVYVKALPETDRRLLGEGIKVYSVEALNALIEDYSN